MSTAKSALRGLFFDTKPSPIEVDGKTFLLAAIPMSLRSRLIERLKIKPGQKVDVDLVATWDIGSDIIFECLMVEKETGGGYERAYEGQADRKMLKEGAVNDLFLNLATAAIKRLFPAMSKEDLDNMGKDLKTTEISTSSQTTSASTDNSLSSEST